MVDQEELLKIIKFSRVAIKMKETYRFTPKKNGQFENDAEHSWNVALLCMLIGSMVEKEVDAKLDTEKILKMAIIHDFAEVITGDTKTWDKKARIFKDKKEKAAITEMFGKLPDKLQKEFFELWNEYEAKETLEAKVVKSLDRLEPVFHRVLLDHGWENLGDDDPDKTVKFLDQRQLPRHEFSDVITSLYKEIRQEALDRKMLS